MVLCLFALYGSLGFFGLFGRHRTKARPIVPESLIHRLPSELILLIASHLPLESTASLRLSCYYLYQCLEMQGPASFKEADYSVIDRFLRLLERDLPTHIVCPHCHKLHPMSSAEHHRALGIYSSINKPLAACWMEDLGNEVDRNIHLEFSSTIFRMAMKAHRQGHEASRFLSLLSSGPARNTAWLRFGEQRTAAVRIQDGSLLVRAQRMFMVPSFRKLPLPSYGHVDICAHIRFWTMTGMYKHGIQIPYADEIEGYENRQGTLCCDYCYTEFRIDFKSYGKAGNAMFITKWMDIGEGRDPSDHKFRSRLGRRRGKTWTQVTFRRGSICAAFEQKAESEFRFSSLLTERSEKMPSRECPSLMLCYRLALGILPFRYSMR